MRMSGHGRHRTGRHCRRVDTGTGATTAMVALVAAAADDDNNDGRIPAITGARDFRPWVPPRLVATGPDVTMNGPGTRFRVGELVDESEAAPRRGVLVQLAERRR